MSRRNVCCRFRNNFLEYITKQNKAFREEMKHDIKALQDNIEIYNANLLESLHSETTKKKN
jgi:hypothetical protein